MPELISKLNDLTKRLQQRYIINGNTVIREDFVSSYAEGETWDQVVAFEGKNSEEVSTWINKEIERLSPPTIKK